MEYLIITAFSRLDLARRDSLRGRGRVEFHKPSDATACIPREDGEHHDPSCY